MAKKKTDQDVVVSQTGAAAAPAKDAIPQRFPVPPSKPSTGTVLPAPKTDGPRTVLGPPDADTTLDRGEVARLAYSYWAARDFQGGSAEEDWYRAEAELRAQNNNKG